MPVLIILTAMSILSWIRKKSEKAVESTFYKIGNGLWHKPWTFLILGIIMTVVGGCGWIFVGIEYNEMALWLSTDPDNYLRQSYDFLIKNYQNDYNWIPQQAVFFSFIAKTKDNANDNGNILNSNILSQIYEFEQLLLNFTWKNKSYQDYCYLPYENATFCTTIIQFILFIQL